MRNDKMPGDWLFKVVPIFIGVVFVLVVCVFITAAVIGTKAVRSLNGCTPAVITETKDGQTSTSIGCKAK